MNADQLIKAHQRFGGWAGWFGDLILIREANAKALCIGLVADQAAL